MRSSSPSATTMMLTGSLPLTARMAHEGFELGELWALGVGGSAADEDFFISGIDACGCPIDEATLEGRGDPGFRLGNGHGVVHPVEDEGFWRAFVALGIDDGVAGGAVLGNADVVDARGLAAELVEEALDHLGGFGDAFPGVRDAGLLDPVLEVGDVIVDVGVDVVVDLLEVGRGLGEVGGEGLVAVGADVEGGMHCGGLGGWRRRMLAGSEGEDGGSGEEADLGERPSLHVELLNGYS